MRGKHSKEKSSLLVSIPCLLSLGVVCILSAFYDNRTLVLVFTPLFLLAFIARLWTFLSSRAIKATLKTSSKAVFPNQDVTLKFNVNNKGFFPITWINLYIPLPKSLYIISEDSIVPDKSETLVLAKGGFSTKLIGIKRCGKLSGYGKTEIGVPLKAKKRGICTLKSCKINTGDGFGLSESSVSIQGGDVIAIYPKLIGVDTTFFLNNLYEANSSRKGLMEDLSVIRSTRNYQHTDSLKHINWRLLARALPLTVNIYENMLPKSIHIIFDGESFSSPIPHLDEMEMAISVIASLLLALHTNDIRCYVSFCQSKEKSSICISPEEGINTVLFALAAYEPLSVKLDSAGVYAVKQDSVFDIPSILNSNLSVGHFYYFTYDSKLIADGVFECIDDGKVTIVSSLDSGSNDSYKHISIDVLTKGDTHEI